jgi:hypothetical protein
VFLKTTKLDSAERLAFATAIVRTVPGSNPPSVPGSERVLQRGGRVLASVGGMYLELAAAGAGPDVDIAGHAPGRLLDEAIRPAVRAVYTAQQVPDAAIDRLVPPMIRHWRDGRLSRIYLSRDRDALARVHFVLRGILEAQEIDGLTGATRWPHDRLIDYWDMETRPFVDRRGRW